MFSTTIDRSSIRTTVHRLSVIGYGTCSQFVVQMCAWDKSQLELKCKFVYKRYNLKFMPCFQPWLKNICGAKGLLVYVTNFPNHGLVQIRSASSYDFWKKIAYVSHWFRVTLVWHSGCITALMPSGIYWYFAEGSLSDPAGAEITVTR